MSAPVLAARGLRVEGPDGRALVDGVSLVVRRGEVLGLVGASGAGKTLTGLALLGLVPPPARQTGGEVTLRGRTLAGAELRRIRGRGVALVPQDPLAALDPVQRVGAGVAETLRAHAPLGRREARARAAAALAELGVPRDDHPHRLSGGQRQRALIAMALAPGPAVLVADEPTAAIDAAARTAVLDLIDARRRADGLGVLLISHDLGAVARLADRVAVIDDGRIVAEGPARSLLGAPGRRRAAMAPPGAARAGTAPAPPPAPPAAPGPPVLELRGVRREMPGRGGAPVRAVDDLSLVVGAGEAVGLVGASGSGKTTVARLACGLVGPDAGTVWRAGRPGIVFQDPYLSLDPRMSVKASIAEPMAIAGVRPRERAARVAALVAAVGLPAGAADRRPAGLSGGQRQRVAIARALAMSPRLVVLDEPTSALDPPTAAAVMGLLARLRAERGLAYLLISHDLGAVAGGVDRLAVMDAGRIVEEGDPARVLGAPGHPASRRLVAAAQALSLVPWAWPGSITQA
ncbi:ABC transporter ATP-binding protein [Miltoncostaea marina]|uniref:ABC transporter ATP-binding protein n=1 Tax=Miltoncostaea marina TaxID=2843215 RepID=UPI001C3D6EE2|nr:ABC transporter ATP-binding protein [Miltoncostaea marina]